MPTKRTSAWDLERLVSDLRAARRSQDDWCKPEVDTRLRPSHAAIVEIVSNLRAVLFPTHFGGCDSDDARADYFVGGVLDSTLRSLQEQVRRALTYVPTLEGADASALEARARDSVRVFAESMPRVRVALERDIRAAYEGDPAAESRSELLFCYPGITAIIHHRLAHELYRLGLTLLARVVSEIARGSTGIDIHPGARIGESFFIDHGTGVVIGETAVIGKRVRLYQGVTLGARRLPRDARGVLVRGVDRHPIVEDDVVIYAGATILGRVTIGRGSTIGGNVWLTRSVAPNSLVTQASVRDGGFDDGTGPAGPGNFADVRGQP